MPVELSEKKPEDFDPEDLREDFARDCDMGNADACFNLGEWHQVVKRDYIKAGNVFEKNCNEKQNGNSCFGLGALYAAGKGRERDFKRARELFSKACSLGHTRGCDIHGATCLDTSNGAPKDIPGAEKSYTAACAREYAPSCYRLGLMHLTGQLGELRKLNEKAKDCRRIRRGKTVGRMRGLVVFIRRRR